MVNIEKLRDTMKARGVTVADAAAAMGVNESTFFRKINRDGETFTIGEVENLSKALHMTATEVTNIFFT